MLLNNKHCLILIACLALLFDSFLLYAHSASTKVRVFSKHRSERTAHNTSWRKTKPLSAFEYADLTETHRSPDSQGLKKYELSIKWEPVRNSRGKISQYHIDEVGKFLEEPFTYEDLPIRACFGFIPTCHTYVGHPVPRVGKTPNFLKELKKKMLESGFQARLKESGGVPIVVRLEHPDGRILFVGMDGNHRITAAKKAKIPYIPAIIDEFKPTEHYRTLRIMDLTPGMPKPSKKLDKGWVDTFIPKDIASEKLLSEKDQKRYRLRAAAYYAAKRYKETPKILGPVYFWRPDNRTFANNVMKIVLGEGIENVSKPRKHEARESVLAEIEFLKEFELNRDPS